MPVITSLLASPSTGANAQTIPVFGFCPSDDSEIIPPGIPPMPVGDAARAADATSAPLPTNVTCPFATFSFQALSDSFSPQVKIIGPFEPFQYTGDPCR